MRFAFIATEKAAFPVRVLCRTLQVSRAGFYAWQGAATGPAGAERRPLGRGDRGDPRGEPAAVWQSTDSCRAAGARLPHQPEARGAADAPPRLGGAAPPAVPDDDPFAVRVPGRAQCLGAAVRPGHPGQAWVTDITYIPTGEGWLYLAVILALCSRFAVGWAMSERITDDLTLDALGMALARRQPPPGLLHHSDRGRSGRLRGGADSFGSHRGWRCCASTTSGAARAPASALSRKRRRFMTGGWRETDRRQRSHQYVTRAHSSTWRPLWRRSPAAATRGLLPQRRRRDLRCQRLAAAASAFLKSASVKP